jgi:hypothetical protein
MNKTDSELPSYFSIPYEFLKGFDFEQLNSVDKKKVKIGNILIIFSS